MSREFGETMGVFFHNKVKYCLDDLKYEARVDFHKKFIPLFEELKEIAWAISSVEASDSSVDRSIIETIERLPKIEQWIQDMRSELNPYIEVARHAIKTQAENND